MDRMDRFSVPTKGQEGLAPLPTSVLIVHGYYWITSLGSSAPGGILTAQVSAWVRRHGGCTVCTGTHGRPGWPENRGQTVDRPQVAAGNRSALQGVTHQGRQRRCPSPPYFLCVRTLQEAGHILQLRDAVLSVAAVPFQKLERLQMLPAGVGSVETLQCGIDLLPVGHSVSENCLLLGLSP